MVETIIKQESFWLFMRRSLATIATLAVLSGNIFCQSQPGEIIDDPYELIEMRVKAKSNKQAIDVLQSQNTLERACNIVGQHVTGSFKAKNARNGTYIIIDRYTEDSTHVQARGLVKTLVDSAWTKTYFGQEVVIQKDSWLFPEVTIDGVCRVDYKVMADTLYIDFTAWVDVRGAAGFFGNLFGTDIIEDQDSTQKDFQEEFESFMHKFNSSE